MGTDLQRRLREVLKYMYDDTTIVEYVKEAAADLSQVVQKYPKLVKESGIYAFLTFAILPEVVIDVLSDPSVTDMSLEAIQLQVMERLKERVEFLKNHREILEKAIQQRIAPTLLQYLA